MANSKYIEFDSASGYPSGSFVFYECIKCGGILPSLPDRGIGCSCRNIFIDVDAGRISIKDDSLLRIFESKDR